jgi:hypothetical protein
MADAAFEDITPRAIAPARKRPIAFDLLVISGPFCFLVWLGLDMAAGAATTAMPANRL